MKDKIKWADGIVYEYLKSLIEEQEKGNQGSMSLLTTVKLGAGFLDNYDLVQQVPVFEIQELGKRLDSLRLLVDNQQNCRRGVQPVVAEANRPLDCQY